MNRKEPLRGRRILLVDDEPDVLESLEDALDECIVHKATTFDAALQLIHDNKYDVVVLDIMGVNGFELLKHAVAKNLPTVMVTAHAVTPEALKKSIKLGAISFLPKEEMVHLREFLEEVVLGGEGSIWIKLFDRFGGYFNKWFGPDWKEKDQFFKDFEESLRKSEEQGFM